MMQLFHNPMFRHVVLFLAIVLLMVFCIDKSRQNQRTRNALYNCIYVLYGAAVLKLIQVVDLMMPSHLALCQTVGLLLAVIAALAYWRWVKPQPDIPYNRVFYWMGWGVLVCTLLLQTAFLYLALFTNQGI